MNIETMANKSSTVNNPVNLEKSTSHMSSDAQMEMGKTGNYTYKKKKINQYCVSQIV